MAKVAGSTMESSPPSDVGQALKEGVTRMEVPDPLKTVLPGKNSGFNVSDRVSIILLQLGHRKALRPFSDCDTCDQKKLVCELAFKLTLGQKQRCPAQYAAVMAALECAGFWNGGREQRQPQQDSQHYC